MILVRTAILAILVAFSSSAQEAEPPMTVERMSAIILALDPEARSNQNQLYLTIEDVPLVLVADAASDRMRVMAPIRSADGVAEEDMRRMMQANFDTALDAGYAIAQGRLWAVFIHPFRALEKDQLISGIGPTVNLALTYGNLYTGGALAYRGGDSLAIQRDLIDRLLKKGDPI